MAYAWRGVLSFSSAKVATASKMVVSLGTGTWVCFTVCHR